MEQSTLQQTTPSSFRNYLNTYQSLFIFIISMIVLMVLLYSASNALIDHIGAVEKMKRQVFPDYLSEYLTGINILLQSTAATLLVTGIFVPWRLSYGLFLSGVIFAIYTCYTGLVLLNVFHYIPCSCISLFNMTWTQSLYFNSGVLALTALAYLLSRRGANQPR